MKRKALLIFLLVFILAFVTACSDKEEEEVLTPISIESDDYVVYEGFFLDNEEVLSIFCDIRGEEAPYAILPNDYHVTTSFLPEDDACNYSLYGKKVKVHITGYKVGAVTADDGTITHNEGLRVEITSDDEELKAMLEEIDKNWHVTGSSETAAKYTGYLDFSNCKELDITITGTFGCYLNNSQSVNLNPIDR